MTNRFDLTSFRRLPWSKRKLGRKAVVAIVAIAVASLALFGHGAGDGTAAQPAGQNGASHSQLAPLARSAGPSLAVF